MKTKHKYYNPNPLKKETGDCVIRSLVKATDGDWNDIYKSLFEMAFELKVMPNNDDVWKAYLVDRGFTYHPIKVKKGSKRPTVESFCKSNNKGTFVLRIANHIVTAQDGYFYDLWDCGSSSMYGYWERP